MKKITRNILTGAILYITLLFAGCGNKWEISNPYETVDLANHGRYKANLHTHTTRSDGRLNPHTVVDIYHSLGYNILAITDHNEVTYPWTDFSSMNVSNTSLTRMANDPESMPENFIYENRDPQELGMVAIQSNELSRHHHIGSFFNDHNGTIEVQESLDALVEKNGISMMYHPGRYDFDLDWYLGFYDKYDHLVGMEIYNQGDRYPNDRNLWDNVLSKTMPHRAVWGYSNDDMHSASHIGRNWNVFYLPELSTDWLRRGMTEGLFTWVYAPNGHDGALPAEIHSVQVKPNKGTISISTSGYDSIHWISAGEIIHRGNTIKLNQLENDPIYVRAVLFGKDETVVGTQPFGTKRSN